MKTGVKLAIYLLTVLCIILTVLFTASVIGGNVHNLPYVILWTVLTVLNIINSIKVTGL